MSDDFEESGFFSELFKRVDGLMGVIVSDADGTIRFQTQRDENQVFDSSFSSSLIVANEQANKLVGLGKCTSISAMFKNHFVVQFVTGGEKGSKDVNEPMFVTLIAKKNANAQLLNGFVPSIKKVLSKLASNDRKGE